MRYAPFWPFLMLLCSLVASRTSSAQALSPGLRSNLENNARRLSPITLTITEQHSSELSPEALAEAIGTPASFAFVGYRRRFVWQDGLMYSERSNLNGDPNDRTEMSFDGRAAYIGSPTNQANGRAQPSVIRIALDRLDQVNSFFDWDYFRGAGIELPSSVSQIRMGLAHSAITALIDDGAAVQSVRGAVLDDRTVVRIELRGPNPDRALVMSQDLDRMKMMMRAGGKSEADIAAELAMYQRVRDLPDIRSYAFSVDSESGYGVLQREERDGDGRLLRLITNSDLVQLGDRGVWLPRHSVETVYQSPTDLSRVFDRPLYSITRDVEGEIGLLPPSPDIFAIVYTSPGTMAADDYAHATQVGLKVPVGGEYAAKAFQTLEPSQGPVRTHDRAVPGSATGTSGDVATDQPKTLQTPPVKGAQPRSVGIFGSRAVSSIGFGVVVLGLVALITIVLRRRGAVH